MKYLDFDKGFKKSLRSLGKKFPAVKPALIFTEGFITLEDARVLADVIDSETKPSEVLTLDLRKASVRLRQSIKSANEE